MKKLLFTIIALLCLQTAVFGQDQFISIKNKYTFNLPQMGVSLSIPAYGGFTVPMFTGKNVSLNVNDKTYYFLDSDYIEEGKAIFKFKPKGAKENMMLVVYYMKGEPENHESLLQKIKETSRFELLRTSLKTKIGNTIPYRVKVGEKSQDVHAIPFGKYMFLFSIPTETQQKDLAAHEGIIKSLEAKDFTTQMADYETRINSGYFDYEAKAPKDVDSRYKYDSKVGKFEESTTLAFQEIDLTLSLPGNTLYKMKARNIEEEANGERQVAIYKIDLGKSLNYMPSFNAQGIPIYVRVTDNESLMTIFSPKDNKIFKSKKFNLDGTEATVEFGGDESVGNLNIMAKVKGVYYIFSFFGVCADNIATIDKIVASIKLPKENGISQATDKNVISTFFPLKKLAKVPYSKITIPKIDREKYPQTFECQMTDGGFKLEIPGLMKDYLIRPDDNFKKVNDKLCTLSGLPKFFDGWFGVTSGPFIAAIETTTAVDTKSWLDKAYHETMAGNYCTPTEAGLITINGIEWAVLTGKLANGSFRRMIYHVNPEFTFLYMFEGADLEEIKDKSSFLHSFKML